MSSRPTVCSFGRRSSSMKPMRLSAWRRLLATRLLGAHVEHGADERPLLGEALLGGGGRRRQRPATGHGARRRALEQPPLAAVELARRRRAAAAERPRKAEVEDLDLA